MLKLEINIPEGHEIDLEKSNLSQGLVYFKKVEDKYPTKFEDLKTIYGFWIDSSSDLRSIGSTPAVSGNRNTFPEEKQALAIRALAQLLQLRQRYLEIAGYKDWVPDYTDSSIKYIIVCEKDKIYNSTAACFQRTISFPTQRLRDLFLTNFKDLLEIAKPLL